MSLLPSRHFPLLLISGALLAGALPASARLGETREECVARYGEPVASTPPLLQSAESVSFLKNQVRIRVEFLNNRAVFISFMRLDMTSDDREKLLDANKGGLTWDSPEEYMGRRFWLARTAGEEESRHATGYTISKVGVLEMSLQPWVDAMKVQKTAMDTAVMEGRSTESALAGGTSGEGSSSGGTDKPAPKKPAGSGGLDDF